MIARHRWLCIFGLLAAACGGSGAASAPVSAPRTQRAAEPTAAEGPAREAAGEPTEEEVDRAEDEIEASGEAPASPERTDPNRPRQVLYRITPNGLVTEVDGASFLTTASSVRRGRGWGVRVEVEATSIDGAPHRLLAPTHGPLAFSVEVKRGSRVDRVGDSREGSDEQIVPPRDSSSFGREWPPEGEPGLTRGQSVTIRAGLWGLAKGSARRRPVRKFAVVQMVVGGAKPKAYVNPPD